MPENQATDPVSELFWKEYGELVQKHKRDFIHFPMWVPEDAHDPALGVRGWRLIVQSQIADISNLPQKSPFTPEKTD